jgi:hypothetical protein
VNQSLVRRSWIRTTELIREKHCFCDVKDYIANSDYICGYLFACFAGQYRTKAGSNDDNRPASEDVICPLACNCDDVVVQMKWLMCEDEDGC